MRMLLALLAASLAPACQHAAAQEDVRSAVRVTVDPRIELASAVQLLSGYFLVSRYDTPYKEEMRAHFGPYAEHKAVTLFRQMSEDGFHFSSVPDTIMRYTPPPDLAPRVAVPPHLAGAAGGEARLAEFLEALRDFAGVTHFGEFYRGHRAFYDRLAEHTLPEAKKVVAQLESYMGMPVRNGTIVLGPLLHDGGFAAYYEMPGGGSEAYAFVGPTEPVDGTPHFGGPARLEDLVAHEFGHLIVNPLGDRHQDVIARLDHHFAPIADSMRSNGYPSWKITVDEHVIRALTVRLAAKTRGEAAAAAAMQEQLERGFIHVPALAERLQRFERERDRYPTLADFYPKLLEAFDTLPGPAPEALP